MMLWHYSGTLGVQSAMRLRAWSLPSQFGVCKINGGGWKNPLKGTRVVKAQAPNATLSPEHSGPSEFEDVANQVESLALKLAKQAGSLKRETSGRALQIETKAVRYDLVTEVDTACERLIQCEVQTPSMAQSVSLTECHYQWFPSESRTRTRWNRNIYNPFYDELFHARRGRGAFLNGGTIRVLPTETELEDTTVTFGIPSKTDKRAAMLEGVAKVALHCRSLKALGSAALHMSYVAAGRFGCFFENDLKPWDIAAGLLMIKEAGGRVSDLEGKPVTLNGGRILASNGGIIHDRILELLKQG